MYTEKPWVWLCKRQSEMISRSLTKPNPGIPFHNTVTSVKERSLPNSGELFAKFSALLIMEEPTIQIESTRFMKVTCSNDKNMKIRYSFQ